MEINELELKHEQILFNYCSTCQPAPGSKEELKQFEKIQQGFSNQFELFFPDNLAPKTIVVIPSLTLDQEVLAKVEGALHYEERLSGKNSSNWLENPC